MKFLLLSLIFFILMIATHFLFCKFRKNRKVDATLISLIALFWLAIFIIFLILTDRFLTTHDHHLTLWNMPLVLTSILIYLSLVPFYFLTHLNTVHQSPSLAILLSFRSRKNLIHKQLIQEWPDEKLITPRLIDLLISRCVSFRKGKYYLLPRGKLIVRITQNYQKLLNLNIGG